MDDKFKKIARIVSSLLSCIFLFIGVTFLIVFGVMRHIDSSKRKACTEQTEAIVTEMVRESTAADGGGYAPVFSFSVSGKQYTVHESMYSNPPEYSVGEIVTIYYDPDDPRTIYPEGSNVSNILQMVFGGVGIVFFALGLIILIVSFVVTKSKKPKDELEEYYN